MTNMHHIFLGHQPHSHSRVYTNPQTLVKSDSQLLPRSYYQKGFQRRCSQDQTSPGPCKDEQTLRLSSINRTYLISDVFIGGTFESLPNHHAYS